MNEIDLELLERDLDVVSRRLAAGREWRPPSWRTQWRLNESLRDACEIALLVGVGLWFYDGSGGSTLVLGFLALVSLPLHVFGARGRAKELSDLGEKDLVAAYREDLEKQRRGVEIRAAAQLAVALFLVLCGVIVSRPDPFRLGAALFATLALFTMAWRGPVLAREALHLSLEEPDPTGRKRRNYWIGWAMFLPVTALGIFLIFGSPLLIVLSLLRAWDTGWSTAPLVLAGTLALASGGLFAWAVLSPDEDEDEDDEDEGSEDRGSEA